MARNIIDIGVEGNDGTGDSIRESFRKTNENFRELYAVFGQGGQISFTDLDDTPDTLSLTDANKIVAVNSTGVGIAFKTLVAGNSGISITSDDTTITLTNEGSRLVDDETPEISYHLNARGQMIGNLADPTNSLQIGQFNSTYGTNLTARNFAITKGYADDSYVNLTGDLMTGHLSVPAGASGTQVPRASETVLKAGASMTGKLFLSDHPTPLSGAGTPNNADDLQAATKYYVDNANYNSRTNLYVSLNGDDDQTYAPLGKEGRSWSFAFRTLNRACQYAQEMISAADWEPGPYRQLIAYGNGAAYSTVTGSTVVSGRTRVFFSNNSGSKVDQGNSLNVDIISGKLVVGRTSGAKGFVYQYYGVATAVPNAPANSDYFDLENVEGTFILGENLEYAEPVKTEQITIYIESGIYYEDFPIKVPANVSIVGDEFRRTIIRPADRISRSPWATTWFRRDTTFDGMTIASTEYGYHYLTDPSDRSSTPKNNRDIDVFLCNDAIIIRQITVQGHGGFYMVLDPEGQVLSKSPYCQQGSSFSRSENKQAFRGGQFADGFTGNLNVSVKNKLSNFEVTVSNSERAPTTPCSFVVNGETYQVDAYTDDGTGDAAARRLILKNKEFIKAETIAYINTELTPEFVFDRTTCSRDVGYIIDAIGYDILFDTNYRSIKAALAYYRGTQYSVFANQKTQTIAALTYISTIINNLLSANSVALTRAIDLLDTITDIIENGPPQERTPSAATGWNIPSQTSTSSDITNAKNIVISNLEFLKAEVIAYLNRVYNDIDYPAFSYNEDKCRRDVEYIVYAALYDLTYGGNKQTVDAGLNYYDKLGTVLIPNQTLQTTDAIDKLKSVLASVITNTTIPVGLLEQTAVTQSPGTPASSTQVTNIQNLLSIINTIILGGRTAAPATIEVTTSNADQGLLDSQDILNNNLASIQSKTLAYLEATFSYNQTFCARDTGYIVDAIAHDIYYGGNLKTVQAALAYFKGSASAKVVLDTQLENTLAAIDRIEELILNVSGNNTTGFTRYQSDITQFVDTSLVRLGGTITKIGSLFNQMTAVIGGSTGYDDARELLVQNKEFIKAEVIAWIAAQVATNTGIWSGFTYNSATCSRDVGFIIANLSADLLYGGHYNTIRSALRYYAGTAATVIASQKAQTIAALNYAKTIAANVINQQTPAVVRSTVVQYKNNELNGSAATTSLNGLFDKLTTTIDNPASAPAINVFVYPTYKLILNTNTEFPYTYPTEIMLLSAGNTSMLSNDFTQVNDLGYGLVATNGGAIETVSMFTYYCWAGYYSCNGGQIRSVAGSNAHGEYGIVAEGSNPLEVPDIVSLYRDQVHLAKVYKRNAYSTAGIEGSYDFYIDNFSFVPFDEGFIEINHGSSVGIKTYSLSSVSDGSSAVGAPTGTVLRIQLTATNIVGATSGLAADLTDGQVIIIRAGQQQEWYNVRETQPTRPSTALTYLGDASDDENKPVYRVINYSTINPLGTAIQISFTPTAITQASPAVVTTNNPHGFSNGDRVVLRKIKGMVQLNNNVYYAKTTGYGTSQLALYTDAALTTPVNTTSYSAFVQDSASSITKNGDRAILETDDTYRYIFLTVNTNYTNTTDPLNPTKKLGRNAGDIRIAVQQLNSTLDIARIQTGQMLFAWAGKVHRITSYTDATTYAIISIADTDSQGASLQNLTGSATPGLYTSVDPVTNTSLVPSSQPTLSVGLQKNEPADITVKISTCRATGHDFLDIGTGGYNTTNFPYKIYGNPVKSASRTAQSREVGRGRTFFVSTDQDGFFKVGRFFEVDQGTGSVSFDVGRISLEGVTGLKFKKGVRATEFNADANFTNANDEAIPTQAAVQSYIDRRLGLNRSNQTPSLTIGPGYLDRDGLLPWYGGNATVALKNPLNMSGARISNLGSPSSDSDAANKLYVDSQELSNLRVDTTTSPAKTGNDILVYNGAKWVNASIGSGSDISITLSTKSVSLDIKSGVIVNADVNAAAAIDQTKLNLDNAYTTTAASITPTAASRSGTTATLTFAAQAKAPFATGQRIVVSGVTTTGYNGVFTVISCSTTQVTYTVDAGTATPGTVGSGVIRPFKGVSSFDSSQFTDNNGWISLQSSSSATTGIPLGKIQYIGGTSILGRLDGVAGAPTELSASNIVTSGDGIKNASFTSSGAMTVAAGTPNTYSVTGITTTGAANSLVKTDANGIIDVKAVKVDNYTILDTSSTTLKIYTPGGIDVVSTLGSTEANTSVAIKAGSVSISNNGVGSVGFGTDSGGSISLGLTNGTATSPYIDFNTSSTAVDYNVRIQASGAAAGVGAGTLSVTASSVSLSGGISGTTGSFTTSVTTPLLTTGSSATAGVVTGNWTLSSGSKFQATYADLAEYYEGDRDYEVGTVVVLGGDKEITLTNIFGDHRVAGVVSENAAYVMNVECPGIKVCVALQGRVPVKVVGKVAKGDLLVTSAKPGYAIVNNSPKPGTIIGKSLQNKEDANEGVIEVLVGRP